MKKLRRSILVFLAIGGLVGSQVLGVQNVLALPDCSAGTTLSIVAHPDDDLFYINPKIKQDIDGGKCVETLFLTAGEGNRDPAEPYWQSREAGIGAAYVEMISSGTVNTAESITIAGHAATKYTFSDNDRVSTTFLHLPDGGDTRVNSGNSLKKLWQGDISTVSSVIANQAYTKQQLIDVLRSRMNSLQPTIIRTLDYTQDFSSSDHTDHVATAQFAQAAHQDYTQSHQFFGYLGYGVDALSDNVTGTDLTNKQNAYLAYDPYDYTDLPGGGHGSKCGGSVSGCTVDMQNALARHYVGGSAVKTAHQNETMDGDSGSLAGRTADAGQNPTTIQFGSDLWVFYYDNSSKDLRYAKANSSSPTSWTFGALDTTGDVGKTPTAIVYDNTLHVFYYDATNTNLRHAWLPSGGSWQFNNLDGDAGSLAARGSDVDTGMMPTATVYGTSIQLFYFEPQSQNLRHAWSNAAGTSWSFENLDGDSGSVLQNNTNTGYDPTVTVYDGTLQLFYYDATNGDLRHVWENAGWHQEALDGGSTTNGRKNANLGLNPAVAVHGTTLQLAYYDQTNGNLRHAWSDTNGWHFENLDGDEGSIGKRSGIVGTTPSIISDGTTLQIFAYDTDRGDLRRYRTSSTVSWQAETIDGRGNDGNTGHVDGDVGYDSVAVQFAGNAHVFYYDITNTNFRHSVL